MSITATSRGLTVAQVLGQRRKYGENRLPSTKRASAWAIFFGQFKNPLVYIIPAAAAISLAVSEYGAAARLRCATQSLSRRCIDAREIL